ncbi:hypothetical protein E3N88_19606 [Mikania micrantha]|uniref:Uncharacterized protein n=1 Tax=Mikania micrantha TaxID=192012 RepID=A0A5N6NQC3_9ASTR|nr:hypothetical protein E3N88_19606 [Mikania micrantha]
MDINGVDSFTVKVINKVVVHADEPWTDHWLPFTNFDLLVPPFDAGSTFFYKKPSHGSFQTTVSTLKASLPRVLALFEPLAGQIAWNKDAGENQIHCNNHGVEFIEAVADVELKELNLYNPDECIDGKLMPKKVVRGVLVIQVTKLKCEGIVIGVMSDHRVVDGYSANMFISSWADITRSITPSMIPSFGRSYLQPRSPTVYSPLIHNVFAVFEPSSNPDSRLSEEKEEEEDAYKLVNRIYYIKGEQLKNLQLLASQNGCRRSKLVSFTSFLWKEVALSMEDSGKHHEACNVVVSVDGRRRLGEGEGEEKEKLMASHFGNVLSMPYGSKKSQPRPLISKAFVGGEMSFSVSAGQRFETMEEIDFGWGKVTFGSCHIPSERKDCFVMPMGSPINNEDWIVYTHMPRKHMNYIEAHAGHIFKPLNANYLNI